MENGEIVLAEKNLPEQEIQRVGAGVTYAAIISKVNYETGKIFFDGNTKPRFDEEITDENVSQYKGGD